MGGAGGSGSLPTQQFSLSFLEQFSFKAFEGTTLRLLTHVKTTLLKINGPNVSKCSLNQQPLSTIKLTNPYLLTNEPSSDEIDQSVINSSI